MVGNKVVVVVVLVVVVIVVVVVVNLSFGADVAVLTDDETVFERVGVSWENGGCG